MPRTTAALATLALSATLLGTPAGPAAAAPQSPGGTDRAAPRQATAVGSGGAVTSVDPNASRIGLQVLKNGGNAVEAAGATAPGVGVPQPDTAGHGGGGDRV